MRQRVAAVSIASALLLLTGCGFDYADWVSNKIQKTLGSTFGDYQAFSYPTDNFGLATIYLPEESGEITDLDFFCDTWNCLGIDDIPSDPELERSVNGFAAVGDNGATISLTEKEQREFAVKGLLPTLFSVVGLSASYDADRVVSTRLTIGQAFPRKLRRRPMIEYLRQLPPNDPLSIAYGQGALALVVADVVVEDVSVHVELDESLGAELAAKLDGATAGTFGGTELDLSLGHSTEGTFSFEIRNPVVVLHLIKRQPAAGELGAEDVENWDDWGDAEVQTVAPEGLDFLAQQLEK